MEADALARYIAAFNDRRYSDMCAYYASDVELVLPSVTLHGPDGIQAYYSRLHAQVDEWLRVDWQMLGDARIAIEVYTEFYAKQAHPEFSLRPLEQGERFRCTNFVHYDLRGDLFHRIRVGRYKVHPGQVSERRDA